MGQGSLIGSSKLSYCKSFELRQSRCMHTITVPASRIIHGVLLLIFSIVLLSLHTLKSGTEIGLHIPFGFNLLLKNYTPYLGFFYLIQPDPPSPS